MGGNLRDKVRLLVDKLADKAMLALTLCATLLALAMLGALLFKSWPVLSQSGLGMLLSSRWKPSYGEFGFLPAIAGSVAVTGIAVLIAVPFALLTAIYLSEYAGGRIRSLAAPMIDLLSGIPSVVFGVWGVLTVVPFVKWLASACGTYSTGYTVLAAGIVLAIMIFPLIIHVTLEVFRTVPRELREASLTVGATKWQTVKHVVLRKSLPGIVAAVVLGVSRAFGETMAVLMVAGNVMKVPESVFSPAYPLPALIANYFGEVMSIPMFESALMLAALMLLCVVVFFNAIAKLILTRLEKGMN